MDANDLKRRAALAGVEFLRKKLEGRGPYYFVLGTGSTVSLAFSGLSKLDIIATDTSSATLAAALKLGMRMLPLGEFRKQARGHLVYAIDGADEILLDREAGRIHMIKGGGGCHTKEKEAELLSDVFVAVADSSKLVERLGQKAMLPVEIGYGKEIEAREQVVGAAEDSGVIIGYPNIRMAGDDYFVTDYRKGSILDVPIAREASVARLAKFGERLESGKDIISHGLFLDMATAAVIAGSRTEVFERK